MIAFPQVANLHIWMNLVHLVLILIAMDAHLIS